jgi:hypothetical protein
VCILGVCAIAGWVIMEIETASRPGVVTKQPDGAQAKLLHTDTIYIPSKSLSWCPISDRVYKYLPPLVAWDTISGENTEN